MDRVAERKQMNKDADDAKFHVMYHFHTSNSQELESIIASWEQIPKLVGTKQSLVVDVREI